MNPEARCTCGSPMPRGERIAKPTEWGTPTQAVFFWGGVSERAVTLPRTGGYRDDPQPTGTCRRCHPHLAWAERRANGGGRSISAGPEARGGRRPHGARLLDRGDRGATRTARSLDRRRVRSGPDLGQRLWVRRCRAARAGHSQHDLPDRVDIEVVYRYGDHAVA